MRKIAYISGLIKAATSNMQKHAAWWNPVDWGKALGNWAYDVTNGDVDFKLKTYDYDKIPKSIKDRAAGAANTSTWQALKMLGNAERKNWENSIYNQKRQNLYVKKVQLLSKIPDNKEYARKLLLLLLQYAPSTFKYLAPGLLGRLLPVNEVQLRYAKRNPFAAYARAAGKVPGQVEDYPWWVDTLGFMLGGDKDDALGLTAYAASLTKIPTEPTRNLAAIDKLHAVRNGLYRIQQLAPKSAVQGLNVPSTGAVNWLNLAQWGANPISELLPQISNPQIQSYANEYIHYNNKALLYMRQGADALSQSGMSDPVAAIKNYPTNYYKGLQGSVVMDIRSKLQLLNNIKADIRAGRRTLADARLRIAYLTRKINLYRRLTPLQRRYKNILALSIPGSVFPGNKAVQHMAGWYMWFKDPLNARLRDLYIKNTVHPALTGLASKLNVTLPSW